MNRILFEPDELDADGRVTFGGARAEHVLNVLHGAPGQTLKTGVLDGLAGAGVIEDLDTSDPAAPRVTVRCTHDAAPPAPWIDLILAPPRPRALKRLLPQLAALGVGRLVLVGAEKVEKAFWGAQLLKPAVHRPLLVDGLMQAGTTAVPRLSCERNFRRWLGGGGFDAAFAAQTNRIVAHPYPAANVSPVGRSPRDRRDAPDAAGRPVLAVGPEGGWTDAEVEALEARGFRRLSLGARILRTDTALIALLARLMPL